MNNFIFPHQGDPLLADETLNLLEAYKQSLLALKAQYNGLQKPAASLENPWDDTEKELATLTDELKANLMNDEAFIEANTSVLAYLQLLLNNILKPEMLKQTEGAKLLQDRLDIVKGLKKRVVKETNKLMEMFKDYTENFSSITWEDYVKLSK